MTISFFFTGIRHAHPHFFEKDLGGQVSVEAKMLRLTRTSAALGSDLAYRLCMQTERLHPGIQCDVFDQCHWRLKNVDENGS